jgi:hypothetical protein
MKDNVIQATRDLQLMISELSNLDGVIHEATINRMRIVRKIEDWARQNMKAGEHCYPALDYHIHIPDLPEVMIEEPVQF